MLKKNTVFVIGAGASSEFGLPVGSELAMRINKKMDVLFDDFGQRIISGDADLFFNVTRTHPSESSQYQRAAWQIRDGIVLAHSIDDFLDAHQHDQRVVEYGKAAIAKCILESERESTLFFDPTAHRLKPGTATIDFRKCGDTWLVGLMKLLVRGTLHPDRAKIFERCTFVVFNYDRCVEFFFLHALQRFYNISEQEAIEIVSKAKIFHPYGLAGELGTAITSRGMTPFGGRGVDCYEIGRTMLKTYTESVESEKIKEAVRGCEQVVFLGFAYHDQNMRLLAEDSSLAHKQYFGTARKMSRSDIAVVEHQIDSWEHREPMAAVIARPNVNIEIDSSLSAAELFYHYSKSL